MSAKTTFRNVQRKQQDHIKKKVCAYSNTVPSHDHNWPRRLAITVKIKDEPIVIARTIALSMPYTDRKSISIFHARIIRDKQRTDCLMDRKGYLKVLEMLSSISFPNLQPSQSPFHTMSRDFMFTIELGDMSCPRRTHLQWKNPNQGISHSLEYIWDFFGCVIRERNPDIRLDDLMPHD